MNIQSFQKLERDKKQDYLYNIFQTTVIKGKNITIYEYTVGREEEMRIDKISTKIYQSDQYTEELMALNNIIDPWCLKEGDTIYFCKLSDMPKLYSQDDDYYKDVEKLSGGNEGKNTKLDPSRNKNLNPVIKPKTLKQIDIDKANHVIKIIDSFDD